MKQLESESYAIIKLPNGLFSSSPNRLKVTYEAWVGLYKSQTFIELERIMKAWNLISLTNGYLQMFIHNKIG